LVSAQGSAGEPPQLDPWGDDDVENYLFSNGGVLMLKLSILISTGDLYQMHLLLSSRLPLPFTQVLSWQKKAD
jgi:hypothetical protein